MIIKIILSLFLVSATTLLGYRYADIYRYRKKVLSAICFGAEKLSASVGVLNVTVDSFIKELALQLNDVFSGFEGFLKGERFVCADKKLTAEQKSAIENFINSLGFYDGQNQREIIKANAKQLYGLRDEASVKLKELSLLAVKLGFSAGLMIVVIII